MDEASFKHVIRVPVTNDNKDAIQERYAARGWGYYGTRYTDDQAHTLIMVSLQDIRPPLPDVSDLF